MTNNTYQCPNCHHTFNDDEVFEYQRRKAMKILVEHGYSLRAVGRIMNVHPQSVKYHTEVSNDK